MSARSPRCSSERSSLSVSTPPSRRRTSRRPSRFGSRSETSSTSAPIVFAVTARWAIFGRARPVAVVLSAAAVWYLLDSTPYHNTEHFYSDAPGLSILQWLNRKPWYFTTTDARRLLFGILIGSIVIMVLREVARRRRRPATAGVAARRAARRCDRRLEPDGRDRRRQRLQLVLRRDARRPADAARLDRPGDRPRAHDVHRPVARRVERILVGRVLEPVDQGRLVGGRARRRAPARTVTPGLPRPDRGRRAAAADQLDRRDSGRRSGRRPARDRRRAAPVPRPPADSHRRRTGRPEPRRRVDVDGRLVLPVHLGRERNPGTRPSASHGQPRAAGTRRHASRSACRRCGSTATGSRWRGACRPFAGSRSAPTRARRRSVRIPAVAPYRIDVTADGTFQPSQYDLRQLSAQVALRVHPAALAARLQRPQPLRMLAHEAGDAAPVPERPARQPAACRSRPCARARRPPPARTSAPSPRASRGTARSMSSP